MFSIWHIYDWRRALTGEVTPRRLSQQSVVVQHDEKALQKVKRGANVSECMGFFPEGHVEGAVWSEI